jgi:hypothetical protein
MRESYTGFCAFIFIITVIWKIVIDRFHQFQSLELYNIDQHKVTKDKWGKNGYLFCSIFDATGVMLSSYEATYLIPTKRDKEKLFKNIL